MPLQGTWWESSPKTCQCAARISRAVVCGPGEIGQRKAVGIYRRRFLMPFRRRRLSVTSSREEAGVNTHIDVDNSAPPQTTRSPMRVRKRNGELEPVDVNR